MKDKNTSNSWNNREVRPNPQLPNTVSRIESVSLSIFNIINWKHSQIKQVEINGVIFIYWFTDDVVTIFGKLTSPHNFTNEILPVKLLWSEFSDSIQSKINNKICEEHNIWILDLPIVFWWQDWYSYISSDFHLPSTETISNLIEDGKNNYLTKWEDAEMISDMDEAEQTFYIDESDPEVFLLSDKMSLYQNSIYIQDIQFESLKTIVFDDDEYVYALRNKSLLFYWEIIDRENSWISVQLLPNDEISFLWKDIIDYILKMEGLEKAGMEIYFKRWWCDSFSPPEDLCSHLVENESKLLWDLLWLRTNKTTLD